MLLYYFYCNYNQSITCYVNIRWTFDRIIMISVACVCVCSFLWKGVFKLYRRSSNVTTHVTQRRKSRLTSGSSDTRSDVFPYGSSPSPRIFPFPMDPHNSPRIRPFPWISPWIFPFPMDPHNSPWICPFPRISPWICPFPIDLALPHGSASSHHR